MDSIDEDSMWIILTHLRARCLRRGSSSEGEADLTEDDLLAIRKRLDAEEAERLSPYACLNSSSCGAKGKGRHNRKGPPPEFRPGRRHWVLHSLAYTRYIDKTQVFSLLEDDHITHRVLACAVG